MNGEAEEEEEIELEESDVDLRELDMSRTSVMYQPYLICQEATLHAKIGADMFVDGPGELIVEFPCNEGKYDRKESNDDGNGQEERLDLCPDIVFWCRSVDIVLADQVVDDSANLVQLNRCVHQHSHIVDTQPDDLNSVLQPQ